MLGSLSLCTMQFMTHHCQCLHILEMHCYISQMKSTLQWCLKLQVYSKPWCHWGTHHPLTQWITLEWHNNCLIIGKAPGNGGILAKLLQQGGDVHNISHVGEGATSQLWNDTIIVSLYKKGPKNTLTTFVGYHHCYLLIKCFLWHCYNVELNILSES